jgi:hypothetical protein
MLPLPAWQRETLHFASHIVFFLFVCYGWLIFRAHSLAQIVDFTSLLVYDFGDLDYGAGIPRLSSLMGSCLLFLMEIAQYWRGDVRYYRRFPVPLRGFHIAALIAITIMGMSNEPAQFIGSPLFRVGSGSEVRCTESLYR